MSAPSATATFNGFYEYVTRNPFKTFGGMTKDDFDNMADLYVAENSDGVTDRTTFTNAEFPGTITAAATQAAADQATYPETHLS